MTALAGVWRFDGAPGTDDDCARMLSAQRIYGIHDVAQWSNGPIALGRRLTQLLPEDRFDAQPLVGADGRYVLVADIRLDNRDELSRELGIASARAREMSDAAVLLAAIERWQEGCIEKIFGDYAFACWDATLRRMFLARDPLGYRPLHYHRDDRFFAFSSMPKGLHALDEIPYQPDEKAVAEKLLLIPEDGTQSFFKGIERIPQGHILKVDANALVLKKHWQPKRDSVRYSNPGDYAERLRELLDEAVRCRLRGADTLGVYLSGGLDSGAVAATAARLLAPSGRRLYAFTSVPRRGFHDPDVGRDRYDESSRAAATAALYPNIEHVIVHNEGCPEDRTAVAALDDTFYLYDRPANGFVDAGVARSLERAFAKRNIRVALGGGAGNLGLSYDGMELLPELLRRGRWPKLLHEARALVRAGHMGWRGAVRQTLGPWCPVPLWVWLHRRIGRDIEQLRDFSAVNMRWLSDLDPDRFDARDFSFRPWKDGYELRLWQFSRTDPGNFQKGILAGYDSDERDPTSDTRLLNFCFGVPMEQFLRDGVPRALGLRALADRLPEAVLYGRRDTRQIGDWYENLTASRQAMSAELDRIESCPLAAAAIDVPRLRNDLDNWPTGRWNDYEVLIRYRYTLPRAIAAGHFLRRATRSNQ